MLVMGFLLLFGRRLERSIPSITGNRTGPPCGAITSLERILRSAKGYSRLADAAVGTIEGRRFS